MTGEHFQWPTTDNDRRVIRDSYNSQSEIDAYDLIFHLLVRPIYSFFQRFSELFCFLLERNARPLGNITQKWKHIHQEGAWNDEFGKFVV
jgi:hypothetical protein